MKSALQAIVVALLTVASLAANAATVDIGLTTIWILSDAEIKEGDAERIHIVGYIHAGDYEKLLRECGFAILMERPIEIRIDSPGADIHEAVRMGNLLRRVRAKIRVSGPAYLSAPTECHENAILLVAGAPIREYGFAFTDDQTFVPNIGLARPYPTYEATFGSDSGRVKEARTKTGDFLKSMGASPGLFERMYKARDDNSLDYVPDSYTLMVLPTLEKSLNRTDVLPRNISREKSIEDYLPRVDPLIKATHLKSCAEPLTTEEYVDLQAKRGSNSYQEFLKSKHKTYEECVREQLLEWQKGAHRQAVIGAGLDYEELMSEVKDKYSSYKEEYSKRLNELEE